MKKHNSKSLWLASIAFFGLVAGAYAYGCVDAANATYQCASNQSCNETKDADDDCVAKDHSCCNND